uniref:Uncharacterized protein n=1 Tax=Strongyloides papillosus TaxID=174720 RepID=A0A0N5B5U0_STREA
MYILTLFLFLLTNLLSLTQCIFKKKDRKANKELSVKREVIDYNNQENDFINQMVDKENNRSSVSGVSGVSGFGTNVSYINGVKSSVSPAANRNQG